MKRLSIAIVAIFAVLFMISTTSSFSKTPEVPITYPGDSDGTIARRAQWMEGAKNSGKLVCWGILRPDYKSKIIAEFNKIYPFIKVDHWRGSSVETGARIEAEFATGRHDLDIAIGGNPFTYPRWRKIGMQ